MTNLFKPFGLLAPTIANYLALCVPHEGHSSNYLALCVPHEGHSSNYLALCVPHEGHSSNYLALCVPHEGHSSLQIRVVRTKFDIYVYMSLSLMWSHSISI